MFNTQRRHATRFAFARNHFRNLTLTSIAVLTPLAANAVVVRGHVTDAIGHPVPGARVQLIERGKVEAFAYADADGFYEIRDANGDRFTLLGSANGFLPAIGTDFYGSTDDIIQKDVVLSAATLKQDISVTATGIPTPLPQLTAPLSVIPTEDFATRVGVVDEIRQTPGAFVVQSGQTGSVSSLFIRGGDSKANLVLIDGVPAGDVGGTFDYGTVMSTGIGQMEIYRGPNSAIYGTDAGSSVITINTPRGYTLKPIVNYSGDAGSLHTWRNEVTVGGTHQRLDYFAALARFDTSNAVANDRFHATTSAANIGYDFNGNTLLRFTIRNGGSVAGVPGAYDFQGLSTDGRQSDQDLYSAVTLENRYKGNWHNLLRYGIARKREQEDDGSPVGNLVTYYPGTPDSYTGYVGNLVTIHGANGYSVTGQASLLVGDTHDQASNRDQVYYQSDYTVSKHFIALFGFRYDNERGSFNDYYSFGGYTAPPENEAVQRTNFEYNLQFQGSFWDRLFYSAGGAVEKNHLYGIAGTPKVGLTYVPVRSTNGFFHGTRLRANYATGVQEPTLALQYTGLYEELLALGTVSPGVSGNTLISQYHVTPPNGQRSRTYDLGIDQNIFGEKLVLKAGYFHNMFDHQLEGVGPQALAQYFGIGTPPVITPPATTPACGLNSQEINGICTLPDTAYVNSLAFSAQGAEAEILFRPTPRFLVHAGYTYLAARVIQSFASDAVAGGGTQFPNLNLPTTAIGIFGPLSGGRPFRRAPNTGFFAVEYNRPKFAFAMKGAIISRSDDSTYLEYENYNNSNSSSDNGLLLPNRDLDFGYVKLDMRASYKLRNYVTVFTQLDNLLNDQHIGPIGYPGLPLTVRVGLKLRIFGDK